MSIAVAPSQRRLILPVVAIVLLVADVSTWNALVLATDQAEELISIAFCYFWFFWTKSWLVL